MSLVTWRQKCVNNPDSHPSFHHRTFGSFCSILRLSVLTSVLKASADVEEQMANTADLQ